MGEINLFTDPKFRVSLLDPFATWNPRLTAKFFLNIFIGPFTIGKAAATFEGSKRAWLYSLPFVFSFLLFIVFHICVLAVDGIWVLAWISYLGFAGKNRKSLSTLYAASVDSYLVVYLSLFVLSEAILDVYLVYL